MQRPFHSVFSLMICALFSGGASPSFATLRIADNAPHAALWQQVYDELPSCWKSDRAITVRELPSAEMAALITRNGGRVSPSRIGNGIGVDGCYQKDCNSKTNAGTICLCLNQGTQAELVFAHEYGHFIWDEKLTKAHRASFKRLWQKETRAGRLITKYAGENVEEGFAEVVAYFLRQPDDLYQREPESLLFLQSLPGMEARFPSTRPGQGVALSCCAPTTR